MSDRSLSLGEKIFDARKRAGLDQVQLALKLGTTAATVSRWESGKQHPRGQTLVRIGNTLALPPDWFAEGVEQNAAAAPADQDVEDLLRAMRQRIAAFLDRHPGERSELLRLWDLQSDLMTRERRRERPGGG